MRVLAGEAGVGSDSPGSQFGPCASHKEGRCVSLHRNCDGCEWAESSLLFFSPKKNFYKIKNPENLEKVTRIFFSNRRKMLKKPFNQLFNGNQKILEKLKINLKLRPQNLDFNTYYQLTNEYENLRC